MRTATVWGRVFSAAALLCAAEVRAYELVRHWQGEGGNGTGDFHVASNWVQGSVPGTADLAGFNNYSTKNWLVRWTEDAVNDTFSIVAPSPAYETAFNLNGQTYWATNALNLWQGAGGRVTISNGMLNVRSAGFTPEPSGITTNVYLTVRGVAFETLSATFSAAYAVFDGGSLWVSNRFSVGGVGRGWATVRLEGGAAVGVTNEFFVAYDTGATGTVVNAGGVLRYSGATCVVGRNGYGELILNSGTTRVDRTTTLGATSTATGVLRVTGGSNTFGTVTNDRLNIGDQGRGFLEAEGGTNNTMGIVAGNGVGGVGTMTFSGGRWNIAEHMWSGLGGSGTVTVAGGEVRFTGGGPVLAIGRNAGSTGTVTVAGGLMDMGGNGSVWMGRMDSGTIAPIARLVLTGTGTLRTRKIFEYVTGSAAVSQILFDGGTLQASGPDTLVQPVDDVRLTANGMVVDSAGFNVSVVPELQDAAGEAGAVVKKGAGTLTLAGPRSATGAVSVLGGTLVASNGVAVAAGVSRVDGTLSLTAAHRLTVAAGAALAGTGTVARVTLQDNAALARDKAHGAVSPLAVSDCVAEDRLVVALTGYNFNELRTPLALVRTPSAFVAPDKVRVTLDGDESAFLRVRNVDSSGQNVLQVYYMAGTMMRVH